MSNYRGYIEPGPGYTCPCIDEVIGGVQNAEVALNTLSHEWDKTTPRRVEELADQALDALENMEDRMEALREANGDLREQRDEAESERSSLEDKKEELEDEVRRLKEEIKDLETEVR